MHFDRNIQTANMRKAFENVYKNEDWKNEYGTKSGSGASFECSGVFVAWLEWFVSKNKIKSILDLGCGDFELMKNLSFNGYRYTGVDIVKSIIDENKKNFSCNGDLSFICADISTFKINAKFDLAIMKDVLQHLSHEDIISVVGNLKNCAKKAILVNDHAESNVDIKTGGYRGLNLIAEPFNLDCRMIFSFDSYGFYKDVYMFDLS